MFLKGKDEETNQVVINIPCSCGCHSMNITYFNDELDDIFLSFLTDSFYNQDGIIKTIWKRITYHKNGEISLWGISSLLL